MNAHDTAVLARFNAESMLDRLAGQASAALNIDGGAMSRQDRFAYEADLRLRPIHDRLVGLGWNVETSTHGSVYYTRDGHRLRLSNHDVPATSEREHAVAFGGWSWHKCGYQIVTQRLTLEALMQEVDDIEVDISDE